MGPGGPFHYYTGIACTSQSWVSVDDLYPHGLCGCWMTLHTDFFLVVLISAGSPQLYHDSTLVINLIPAYVYIQCSLEIKIKVVSERVHKYLLFKFVCEM